MVYIESEGRNEWLILNQFAREYISVHLSKYHRKDTTTQTIIKIACGPHLIRIYKPVICHPGMTHMVDPWTQHRRGRCNDHNYERRRRKEEGGGGGKRKGVIKTP